MKKTKKSKDKNEQQLCKDLVEGSLEIVIRNAPLNPEMTKALRLTCKRTKVAADARVRKFELCKNQEPKALQRSGLLKNITELRINFDSMPSINEDILHLQNLSRAVGLLNLALDVCSKSLEALTVSVSASSENLLALGCIFGNSDWESLKTLTIEPHVGSSMSGFLSGVLARPGNLPALRELTCQDPTVIDIKSLAGAAFIGQATKLTVYWSIDAYEFNVAPAMIAAMRILLQKAASVETMDIKSSTFDFSDCERLSSVKSLHLKATHLPAERGRVSFAPVLARPWKTLEDTLSICYAVLRGPELIRLFEAEDTLSVLKELVFTNCCFTPGDTLSFVRRPHLKKLFVGACRHTHALISQLAQLLKEDTHALPSLRGFGVVCFSADPIDSAVGALSKLLSCPCMARLETLTIHRAEIGGTGSGILSDVANYCPNLKHLDLRYNNLGRPAVALLAGYGSHMEAWPKLQKLGILDQSVLIEDDINSLDGEHPYMPRVDVQKILRRAWPGLKCY